MKRTISKETVFSSFRDPSGFLFYQDGIIHRQVNSAYKDNYDLLLQSGLYNALVRENLLVQHEEVAVDAPKPEIAYKVIKPEPIPFISYPYEWCFSQLKDAALATLKIQKKALEFGMTLKDSSAYNIQFTRGKPVLIDTLSFEKYQAGQPWIAYRQFCQHFLAPLALMSYKEIRLNQLSRIYIDGIPLDLASSLLPWSTYFSPGMLSHIHLHARSQSHYADKTVNLSKKKLSKMGLLGIVDHLESTVKNLKWRPGGTEWADYYSDTNYSSAAFINKKEIVSAYLDRAKPEIVWDLGANTGIFSGLASTKGILTISCDSDAAAVEKNYLDCKTSGNTNLLPLIIDLCNPSPGSGWQNRERQSFEERGPADTVLALALIHHLAISNNLPLSKIAGFFSNICNPVLIIEFVPKNDSQVQKLLSTREDIFPRYTKQDFEDEFANYFNIEESSSILESGRTLYLMHKIQK